MLFKDKVAIVTGGSRGIGRAVVLKLAQEGADVAFTYLSSGAQADALVSQGASLGRKILGIQADVRDFDQAKEMVEQVKQEFGRLDLLVNNAGITRDKALMMMAKSDWQEVIDTNLTGTFNVTRNCIVTFLKQKAGSIVNISSVTGVIGMARQTNYAASKSGIIGFTKALAKECAPYNIRVNALAPGFIETDMVSGLREEYKKQAVSHIPLARFGTAQEVAASVSFLLSDAAQFITGQVLILDGGLSLA